MVISWGAIVNSCSLFALNLVPSLKCKAASVLVGVLVGDSGNSVGEWTEHELKGQRDLVSYKFRQVI